MQDQSQNGADEWLTILRCPVCRHELNKDGDDLACVGAPQHRFPRASGRPVLLNEDNSVFRVSDYVSDAEEKATLSEGLYSGSVVRNRLSPLKKLYRGFATWLMDFRVKLDVMGQQDAVDYVAKEKAAPISVLIIGAGDSTFFKDRPEHHYCITDVAPGANIQYICDAHDLPFKDESFDLVVAMAVLEIVADPYRVVEEVHRVLNADGCVFAATPYMQPTHMGVYDFTRFTYVGYRRLFRRFDELALTQALGPASALAYSIQYFLTSFSDTPKIQSGLRLLGLLLTRPLKFLDKFLLKKRSALDAAAGFIFFGKKSPHTISDRALVLEMQSRLAKR